MIYKVLRDCHYVNRYWNAGELANFPNGTDNEHFEEVTEQVTPEVVVEVPEEPNTMSGMNAVRNQNKPKTGMAYAIEEQKARNEKAQKLQEPLPEPVKKRGRPAKTV